ncbi:hypothetical protein F441_21667 [Phytophthora nicotianae CJ01A1]|uniref:Uncharacterized protein n=5 Tax=Phytophthora nicotianae TaxID=4792 RepID=W2QT40_PHYN3|nr:hypothetical protein PPTG_06492 [Phytophthora nicotianae INRA-310]ETI31201.1 hypothetical protein F443_21786 [Phytophthora nicotianae P1569]ETK71601.1 hypothetical protein L915_21179 [Phytophthora nicotianae]ETO59923.1 hypothetical protein F444_21808 [Phytophthora nicotianae P1976]ETP01020.1 hypothetical protein F441_21667 [Phytophthora nicotianae CJ01A1]KUF81966.1 hypothetical protein AM587_10007738 [Phytophthora nicotianae]
MTLDLETLAGVSAAVHAAFPALIAIPQLVEEISTLLDYSALWTLEDASSIGDLRLVKRVAAHDQRRLHVVDPPPSDLARRASFTAAVAEAAEEGHLTVFQWLVTHYSASNWDVTDAIVRASRHGHLDILQWAQSHTELATFRWTTKMMVVAAIEGHFDIVRWLHEHSSAPGSPHVMDCAAEALDLPMVVWLHANRTEGCTPYAMDNAARKGSLEIVQWLHTHRTEGCTTGAMDGAAMNGHLQVLQWLHVNRHEGCTASALHCAAVNGHADTVHWLDENVTVGDRRRAFASAVRWGHLDVVKALAKYCSVNASVDTSRELTAARRRAEAEMRVPNTSSLLRARRERILYSQRILDGPAEENAVWYGRLEVLQFLFSNGMVSKNGRSRAELAATATARGHAHVAKWLLDFTTVT